MVGIDATGMGQGTGTAKADGDHLQYARSARTGVVPQKDGDQLRADRLFEYHQGTPERLYPLLRASPRSSSLCPPALHARQNPGSRVSDALLHKN